MTKSVVSARDAAGAAQREPRPFLYLEPARLPLQQPLIDPIGAAELDRRVSPSIAWLVRSLVDYTIAQQNRSALERGRSQPIQVSVLNRRRRAARSWILAIVRGQVDGGTRHAVATQWVPMLVGSGPDLRGNGKPGRRLIEFLRGALTACVFDETAENLLPRARALHVLESTLSTHLAAVHLAARSPQAI